MTPLSEKVTDIIKGFCDCNFTSQCKAHYIYDQLMPLIMENQDEACASHIEEVATLQAQNIELREVLGKAGVYAVHQDCANKCCSACMYLDIVDKALSSTPSSFHTRYLALEKLLEAVNKEIYDAETSCDGRFGSWSSCYEMGYIRHKKITEALKLLREAK